MKKVKYFILMSGITLLLSPLVSAQEAELLRLEEAIEMAGENNPAYRALQSQEDEIKHSWKSESGLVQPELSYTREGLGNSEEFFEQRIALSQTLEQPLGLLQESKAAEYRLKAHTQRKEAFYRQLVEDVKSQYVRVLYARYTDSLMAQRIELIENLKSAVQFTYEAGSADKIDLLNAGVRLDKAKNQKNASEAELHRERYRLFEIIGLQPENQHYEIMFADSLRTHEPKISQEDVLASLEEYPDYQQYLFDIRANEHKLKAAKAGWLPSVSLAYYQQDFSNGFNYQGFEVGIGIPLWGAFDIRGDVKTRSAILDQTNWQAEGKMLEMKRQVEQAWHAYEETREIIRRYQDNQQDETEELLNLTQEAYRLGQIDLIRLIDAQQLYLDNQEIYLAALRDYYIYLIQLEKFLNQQLVY
ncbi:MAG: TolC family protein [Bacteroidota bacterium]